MLLSVMVEGGGEWSGESHLCMLFSVMVEGGGEWSGVGLTHEQIPRSSFFEL